MKGEVEVTFKCEGCGTTLLVSKHNPANHQAIHTNLIDLMKPGDLQCPNCAKLTYGPLTEEMVAEALETICDDASSGYSEWVDMARFVLRLLNEVGEHKGLLPAVGGDFPESYLDWLLDLARET